MCKQIGLKLIQIVYNEIFAKTYELETEMKINNYIRF